MSLLRIAVICAFLLTLVVLRIGFSRRSREISKQREKVEKVEKVKEKKKEKKKLVNQDIITALQNLGFKRQESIIASQKAVEKLGEAEIEKLIKEALKQT